MRSALRSTLLVLAVLAPFSVAGVGCDGPAMGTDEPDMAASADLSLPAPDMARDPNLGPDEIPLVVEKRCPGDPSCPDSGDNILYVGVGKKDISPAVEPFVDKNMNGVYDSDETFTDKNGNGKFDAYWMAGFGSGRLAYGVHDPVWARALAIRQNQTLLVLVAVDALGLFAEETEEVQKILDASGPKLDIDLLVIHATHVHETADLVGGWGANSFTNGVNPTYQALVRQRIAEAVREAVAAVKPARLTLGSVRVEDGPNHDMRRYVNDVRDPVVIDNTLHTLQFLDIGTTPPVPIATIVNWAHHPESIGDKNHDISSDFPNFLRAELESKGAGTVLYVSGALGGQIGPSGVQPLNEKTMMPVTSAGFDKAEWIGKGVARFALNAMADPMNKSVEGKAAALSFRTTKFAAQIANKVYHLAQMIGVYKRGTCCYDTKQPISDENLPSVMTSVAYIRLGPASIITNPGELLPEFFVGGYGGEYAGTYPFIDTMQPNSPDPKKAPKGPYLVDIMDGPREHRMTFGLSMDFLGYIVPRYNWVLHPSKPYLDEADGDHYEETNSIGPLADPQIVGSMRQLILDGRPNQPR